MRVLLAHPGTQTSFRLAAELHRLSALYAYYTTVAIAQGGVWDRVSRCLPRRWQFRLANRRIAEVPSARIHTRPLFEVWTLVQMARQCDHQRVLHVRNGWFQRSISDRSLLAADVVIGFDTSAAILARRCASLSVPFLLDQTHPDSTVSGNEQIKRRYPDWVEGVDVRLPEVREAEREERALARLIAVAGSFSRRALIGSGVDPEKTRVNPLGVDCSRFAVTPKSFGRPFRFLFVGAMIARKGIPLLLDAWRELKGSDTELWLVGSASTRTLSLLPPLPGMRYLGRLPPSELAFVLQQCDVFVFPSYCEGFGQVILEAMASGLPVITTTATAGPDIITHGHDGWIVEPDNPDELVEAMRNCLVNRAIIPSMGLRARETAERFSWPAYGVRLLTLLRELAPGAA
ncbi:MAG: glycosyltransferase family 4 protein [Acidobacteriota bacterium]